MKINIGIYEVIRKPHKKRARCFAVVKDVEFPVRRFDKITGRMVLDWVAENRPNHHVAGWCRAKDDFTALFNSRIER